MELDKNFCNFGIKKNKFMKLNYFIIKTCDYFLKIHIHANFLNTYMD